MSTDTQLEAQRLVSISLTKMAQSRLQRTGISLHKSLLVATVLQKAKFLCMEEVFRMVHVSPPYQGNHVSHNGNQCFLGFPEEDPEDNQLVGLTPEEAGITNQNSNYIDYSNVDEEEQPCSQNYVRHEISSDFDKENLAPETPTYFDLDKGFKDQGFRERSSSVSSSSSSSSSSSYCRNLKRRRAVCESETEEAIQLMVPKKTKTLSLDSDCDDSVFSDDDPFLNGDSGDESCKSMDIDRITSLVSIFSFGGLSPSGSVVNVSETSASTGTSNTSSYGNLTRSSSTPDLCSAQAKENGSLQQRPFIAMTV